MITYLNFMDALKRALRLQSHDPGRDHGKDALRHIQDEMQGQIDSALLRPSACNARNSIHRLGWLESFELEGRLRAQVDAAARVLGFADKRAEALEALLASLGEEGSSSLLEKLPMFEDIARKASEVHWQLHCAATMDRTSATTRLVTKDLQRAYALRAQGPDTDDANAANQALLVDPLPEGWHPETHNADGIRHGSIPAYGVMVELDHGHFTLAGTEGYCTPSSSACSSLTVFRAVALDGQLSPAQHQW
jgi:hypothetical protein